MSHKENPTPIHIAISDEFILIKSNTDVSKADKKNPPQYSTRFVCNTFFQ